MLSIKPLPEFTEWLDGLADASVRGVVAARIKRLERGLMGDVEPVGEQGVGVAHSFRCGLAHIFRATWRSVDCVACRWLQAHAEG
jgi:hypothetical protein